MTGRRLVLFDVDGTLIDSQDHIVAAMAAAYGALSLPAPARAQTLSIVGLSLPEAIARLSPELDPDIQAGLVAAYKDSFNTRRADPPPLFPGARAALMALAGRDGVILGVATGKSRRGLDKMIEVHGLQGLFATRQVADDHPSKPHPSMVLAALAEAGVRAADAVIVGDTTYDMDMGRAGGIAAIGVGWGYHPAEALHAAGAWAVVDGFPALLPELERFWGRG